MKKLLPFVVFPLLCVIAITCTGGAGFPTTRGVYVDTNGVIISPSNFWLVNLTNANSYYLPVSNGVAVNLVNSGNPFISEGSGAQSFQAGEGANASGSFGVAVGLAATASGFGSVAVGPNDATGIWSLSAGHGSVSSGFQSVTIGHNAEASHSNSIAIGPDATTSGHYEIRLGTDQNVIGQLFSAKTTMRATNGFVLLDRASIPTNAVPTGSVSVTNWLLTTIGGIPQLVATNHADGGWMQKALFP